MKILTTLSLIVLLSLTASFQAPQEKSITKKQSSILFVFFDNCDPKLQDSLMSRVSTFYTVIVKKDTTTQLPKSAYFKPRKRYKADKIISFLMTAKLLTSDKVIGFTNKDISTTKGINPDSGIFGLGQCPGKVCVMSSYRLKSDFLKCLDVALHELGHNYGLLHCNGKDCLMNDAKGKGVVVPAEGSHLCSECKKKLNL